MDPDFDTVIKAERTLLEPTVRADAATVRGLLHEDFREFGASGAIWDRHSIVAATGSDATERTVADDMLPQRLGPDAILLTYTARRPNSSSLRSSIWVRSEGTWLLLHHQGTRVAHLKPARRPR